MDKEEDKLYMRKRKAVEEGDQGKKGIERDKRK